MESDLDYKAKLVGLTLIQLYNQDGYTFPSIKTLMKLSSLSRNPIRHGIKELVEHKFITVTKERFIGNKYDSSVYTFLNAEGFSHNPSNVEGCGENPSNFEEFSRNPSNITNSTMGEEVFIEEKQGDIGRSEVEGFSRDGFREGHYINNDLYIKEKINKKEKTKLTRQQRLLEKHYQEKFQEFWEIYPKKVGERIAKKLFMEIVTTGEADVNRILRGAKRYKLKSEATDQDFIKLPSNWLKDGFWDEGEEVDIDQRSEDEKYNDAMMTKKWQRDNGKFLLPRELEEISMWEKKQEMGDAQSFH